MNKKRANEMFDETVKYYKKTNHYLLAPEKHMWEFDEFLEYIKKRIK